MALQDLTPQLRTRLGRVERLVGLFLLLTVLLMLAGLVYFVRHTARERGWFVPKFPYYTFVAEVTGLRVGTPVTMMGFTVGEVTHIDQGPPDEWFVANRFYVFLGFNVRKPYDGYIWTDSRVRIGGGDFLGTRTLEITRGSEGEATVKRVAGEPARMLSDDFLFDPTITQRTYRPLDEVGNGFWLQSVETQPLQSRLAEIATTVSEALPQVFALTNELGKVLGNLASMTDEMNAAIPKLDATVEQMNGLLGDLRPALNTPGGLGDLLVPTPVASQLTLTLSNLNPGTGPIALTLSNLNGRMADVGLALSNVNLQLQQNTNLLADANELTRSVGSLAVTIETLLKRHWLLRSAFRTNTPPPPRPANPPRNLRRF